MTHPRPAAREAAPGALRRGARAGARLGHEWWGGERAAGAGVLKLGGRAAAAAEVAGDAGDLGAFASTLEEHGVDPRRFGRKEAKTLEALAGEVRSGAARLMLLDASGHKRLVRVVDVVVLRILVRGGSGGRPRLVVETGECYPDGRRRELSRLPGTIREPHENTGQTASRIIRDILALNGDGVQCNLTNVDRQEEKTESPSYPGVGTVYRKEIVECLIPSSASEPLAKAGLKDLSPWSATDPRGTTKFFSWMDNEEAEAKVKLKFAAESISTLVMRAPTGLSEDALRAHLTNHSIDVSKFGQGNAKSLKELSRELVKGESTLILDSTGTLKLVVDVVILIIANPKTAEVLVQTELVLPDGQRFALNRLPSAKRLPDENHFHCGQRIIRTQLDIDENQVKLSQEVLFMEEERPSPFYPGLITLHRKRLIRAEPVDSMAACGLIGG